MEIVARDLGSPQLSTTSTTSVSVERPGAEPSVPKAWTTFSDTEYNAEVKEDTTVGALVHKLTIINKPDLIGHLRCAILDGNKNGKGMKIIRLYMKICVLAFYLYNASFGS